MTTTRQLLIDAASASTIPDFARSVTAGLASSAIVLARIWLVEGDGALRLAGSAGTPTGGGHYTGLDGTFGRIAAGAGKIGRIAASREPFIVRSIRGDEPWLDNPGWIARQRARAFVGFPLVAGGETLGVLAIFDRDSPADAWLDEVRFLADYSAARLAELRTRASRPAPTGTEPTAQASRAGQPRILTRADLRTLEKHAIEAALAATRGRVFGPDGAAVRLGMKPTTLASRIKALGIR